MRRAFQLILVLLPLLMLSQDSLTTKKKPFINIDTVQVSVPFMLEIEPTTFWVTTDVEPHVREFIDLMQINNVDLTPLKYYSGMYTVTEMKPYAKNDNIIGLTFKSYPKLGIFGMTILKEGQTDSAIRILVFHELVHAMTYNELPHCADYVNCSAIFYTHLKGLQERIELYWDMEEEQLVNMIKIYQKYNKE